MRRWNGPWCQSGRLIFRLGRPCQVLVGARTQGLTLLIPGPRLGRFFFGHSGPSLSPVSLYQLHSSGKVGRGSGAKESCCILKQFPTVCSRLCRRWEPSLAA